MAYLGHVMMDNRHGIAIDTLLSGANARAEREAALAMAEHLPGGNKRITLGADKGYDTLDFVEGLRTAPDVEAVGRALKTPKLLNCGPPGSSLPVA